jgi:hypothetical protein
MTYLPDDSKLKILIGFAGRKGAGKDTAGEALPDFENIKFAMPLKLMCAVYLNYRGVDDETIDRMLNGDLKEVPTPHFMGKTPRYAQQTLGTEWGRVLIGDDIWVDTAFARASLFEQAKITDVRFPNENKAVQDEGGTTVKIVDPNFVKPTEGEHVSEALIDDLPTDIVIFNDKTTMSIEQLHEKVRKALSEAAQ